MKSIFFFLGLIFTARMVSALGYEHAINKILSDGGKVSVAVAVADVRLPDGAENSYLRKAVENDILNSVYKGLLDNFSENSRFRLLDRQTVDVVMSEYVFQAKGFTRQIDASKVGNFTNASHLIILSISYGAGKEFNILSKLVAVEDAQILSAEKFSVLIGEEQPRPSPVVLNSSMASPSPAAVTPLIIPPATTSITPMKTRTDWAAKQKEAKNEEAKYLFYMMELKEKGESPLDFEKWRERKGFNKAAKY